MSANISEVSPPPLKRRRVVVSAPSLPVEAPICPLKAVQDERESLRIFSWNVNGITAFLPPDTPNITKYFASKSKPDNQKSVADQQPRPSLRECLHRWAWPDIIGLQEVKIAATDEKTQAAVRRNVNTLLDDEVETDDEDDGSTPNPQYDVHFCLPRDKYNATGFGGKVYGVCTLVKRDRVVPAKVRTVDWDLEGRVLICEIPNLHVAIINVYAVNGTDYDNRDSVTGKVVGTRHDRKRHFHTLLADEVARYEKKTTGNGWHVLVAGDINISRSAQDSFPQLRMGAEHVRSRADFEQKFIKQLGMLDTYRQLHGDIQKYTYRPRGKPWGSGGDRVDMILATKGLEDSIVETDLLDDEYERGPSDHVPHYIKLNLEQLQKRSLDTRTQNPRSFPEKRLSNSQGTLNSK